MAKESPTKPAAWPMLRPLAGASIPGLGHDLIAGLTLAAIAIPEQMATARLGGFSPQIGFFAFVAAAIGFSVFGSSRQMSVGADSTITPIFAGSLALMAASGSPQYGQLAAALGLMVGLVLVLAGVFRLGWIADLLSTPVITGFLAGISLHIMLSQAPALLGLPEGSGDVFHRLAAIAGDLGGVNLAAVGVGVGVFAVTFGAEKLSPRIPGALIALVGATVATVALGLDRHGLAVLGQTPGGLPKFALPLLHPETLLRLVGLALVVSLVVMVQTAATARSFSAEGEEPDIDRDYIGVGAASALAGLFGAFPVNASPPRTAIATQSGGRTQFTSLAAAAAVLALVLFGTALLRRAPTAALAGVLMFVAMRIFHVGVLAELWRRTRGEFLLAVITLLMIVLLPIQTGVAVGIFFSLAHGVFSITRVRPIVFERAPGTTVWWPASEAKPGERAPGVLVMGFQAPLSFLNATDFRKGMEAAIAAGEGAARLLVLEASSIVEIDFTAAAALNAVIDIAKASGMDFAVARLESVRAQAAFDRFGVSARLGDDHIFRTVEEAVRALAKAPAG